MSVYKHRNSPYWQFDFQLKGCRFSGSIEIPVDRPKREAEKVEEDERRAAERLLEERSRSGRSPMTLKEACDRWWHEVGQHGREVDLRRVLPWLYDQIGPGKPLHAITTDDVAKAVSVRRTHVIPAGRDEKWQATLSPDHAAHR